MNKIKLTQHFVARTAEGNREITFVANTGKAMASGETVDLATLQVRDPDSGATVLVKDVKATDVKNWMPLLKDHMPSIDSKVGEVRSMAVTDDGLVMTAKLASTDDAERIYQLAKDDMLDTFSITVALDGEPGKDGILYNSRLLETSVVWLGNDENTKLLSVNNNKENDMTSVSKNELTPDEASTLSDAVDAINGAADAIKSLIPGDGASSDTPEEPAQNNESTEEPKPETSSNAAKMVRQNLNAAKSVHQNVTVVKHNDYISSNQALKDFTRAIVENRGERAQMNAWSQALKRNGYTGTILPTDIEQVFFKTWFDEDSILSTFRFTTARMVDLNAFTGTGEGIQAKGHKPGEKKAEQVLSSINRQIQVKGIYKMLGFDLQQLVDDASGELTTFRAQELAKRVAHAIARGAILGDGRAAPEANQPDYRVFDGTRGLFSIKGDLDGSATANTYAAAVASQVTVAADTSLWEKAVRALSAVRVDGPKVLVLPRGGKAEILLSKDANSRLQFAPGTNVDSLFETGTKVFEMEGVEDSGYDVIAYANNGYVLNGDRNGRVFTDFDITTNRDVMEVVRYVGGSLDGGSSEGGQIAAGVKHA